MGRTCHRQHSAHGGACEHIPTGSFSNSIRNCRASILSTLPSAGVGALLALEAAHLDLSVIGIIGVILLIGIVKKNGIMLVDFAIVAERDRNLPPNEAIREACLRRFRPILMTTAAAMLAGIPLMLGTGTGSELRQPLGYAAVGGSRSNADAPNPTLLAYATTKGAIQNFTAGLAQLLAEKGIRANAVAPGPIWTPLIPSTMPEGAVKNFGKQTPMKRPGQPAELATAYVMLADPLSSYVSGATIAVTGGKPIL